MRELASLAILFLLFGCSNPGKEKLFTIRHGKELGIDFQNTITTSDTLNALTFEYVYNGSGVGVGDFNNDGLEDLFFGGNQVSGRLYLNQGGLQFKDVTKEAGVSTDRWVTGVSVVDINQDGLLDIFLAVAGKTSPEKMRDLLFINEGIKDGIPEFKESAEAFGIADEGYGTMGAFFDYDKDGDPDLYLLTNALEKFNRNNLRPKRMNGEASSTDRLYRNNGDNTFTNVSREAGILIEGYGLGVNICDLNRDGWPDVYTANDFMSNDLIWINQKDGTFQNKAGDYLKHQTHNGMGVDVADFNNDALADIVVVDMLPPGHKRQKMMTPGQNYDHFHMSQKMGYQPQYMRNTLQLNRGELPDGNIAFSEIAFMAGVSSTDWSWAPLLADFDNDGLKDLFIANGYRKDVTDLDFIFFGLKGASPFGSTEKRQKKFSDELASLPEVKLSNQIFRNTGSLVFSDHTLEWGVELPTFTNGAAYSDLDSDGDLDIITNNIDQEVILYENRSRSQKKANHFVQLHCTDTGSYNHKIWIFTTGTMQYFEATPYRGFQSSVSADIHAGLNIASSADSIKIVWQDNAVVTYRDVPADTIFSFSKRDAHPQSEPYRIPEKPSPVQFTETGLLNLVHAEKSPSDIKITRTLLHELTRYGPCLTKGDINNDQLDDIFIGAERGKTSRLFIQQQDGTFQENYLTSDTTREDGDALFFDADSDGDADLYVASACPSGLEDPQPHILYLNDGKGGFKLSNALPEINSFASCVIAEDYDQDGDLDLFVGGRIKQGEYPMAPRSYLLQNKNGIFKDVTDQVNKSLVAPGLVSSAVWADINNDTRKDLIIAGEWMPIRVFINEGKKFSEQTESFDLRGSNGWWNCVRAADLNHDGYVDIVAGNTGRNSFFQPSVEFPVMIVAKDFDKNGSIDPLITYYNPVEKDRFILHNRLVLIDQVPGFKKRFETFSRYASASFKQSFRQEELADAFEGRASTLASVMLVNEKGKRFRKEDLPELAQLSSINDILLDDFNGDGNIDLLAVGNNYAQETLFGRYDASLGAVMLGDGNLHWKEIDNRACGFVVEKDARQMEIVRSKKSRLIIVTQNNGPVKTFVISSLQKPLQ